MLNQVTPSKDFIGPNSMGIYAIKLNRKTRNGLMTDEIPESNCAKFMVEKLEGVLPIVLGERNRR